LFLEADRRLQSSAEVEVTSFVGLQHAPEIKTAVASVFLVEVGWRLPFPGAPVQFVLFDEQFETTLRHV
jgi:hypothetical protein